MKRKGKKIALITLASFLAVLIIAVGLFFGIASCTGRSSYIDPPAKGSTTVRKPLPADGSLPVQHSPIENIGYMATVLDSQPFYHVYAHNSTRSTGYEQVTRSWKDYKSAELSGIGQSVMVCSDLSHSALVQSSSQSCFVGSNAAYVRSGKKPSKNSMPEDIQWNTSTPTFYDKESYLTAYGEFSTELSVYVINEDTLESAEDVIDNGDGTYSQKYILKPEAAGWYQYGMKTRGGLKSLPDFKSIEITFTFDAGWQVLSSYCEEKAEIAPSALGGFPLGSNSKTTTTFSYGESEFGNSNYEYFATYFEQYLGTVITPEPPAEQKPELLDVLGGGFAKVVNGVGQQFGLSLTLGQTKYDGKLYLSLGDLGDVINSLNVRLALEKSGSGKQDLFIEFADGKIKVYFSDGFAMSASIDGIFSSVNKITDFINGFNGKVEAQDIAYALIGSEDSSFDLSQLLNVLDFTYDDTSATISLKSDDLLNLGIGVDARLDFDRTVSEDGDVYAIKNIVLNSLSYGGEGVDLSAEIKPDDGSEIISRNPSESYAELEEYIDSVLALLNSNSYKLGLKLDDTLVEGLNLDADVSVSLKGGVSAFAGVQAEYKGLTVALDVYYVYDKDYGKAYINLTEFNGTAYNAKVYCDIKELADTIGKLIGSVNSVSEEPANERTESLLVSVINKLLALDFGKIITDIKGDGNSVGVSVNVDEILKAFEIDLGIEIGEINLAYIKDSSELVGSAPSLGLDLALTGSDEEVTAPADKENYVDIVGYIESVYALLNSQTLKLEIGLDGTLIEGLRIDATAYVKYGDETATKVAVEAEYNGITVALDAYYVYDGGYGKVYLNLTEFNGKVYDAKVYCEIKETVEAVQKLIALFGKESGIATAEEESTTLAKALEVLLALDYNQILKVNNEKLEVTVNADEILKAFEIDLGIEIGEVNLTYIKNSSELVGSAPSLGLDLSLTGSDEEVTAPADKENYVDIVGYIESVYALLNSQTLKLEMGLDGTLIEGLRIDATAYVKYGDETATKVMVEAEYNGITVALDAYYVYDGGYGKVYLNLTEFNGKAYDAKVYCDIKETVEAVQKLIALFGKESGMATSEEESATLAKALEVLLALDYNQILKVNNEKLEVTVNADEILKAFEIDLGIEIGEVKLAYINGSSELVGSAPSLGLDLALTGSGEEVTAPADKENYVDINRYLDEVTQLIAGRKYAVTLNIDGTKENDEKIISYLKGVKAEINANVQLSEDFKTVSVNLSIAASYKDYSVKLNAYYCVAVDGGNYGKIYLNLTEINGRVYDAKAYCEIKETVEAVQKLIAMFGADGGVATASDDGIKLAEAVSLLLSLDYNKIVTVTDSSLNATLDVDGILAELGVNIGINIGEVKFELTLSDGENPAKLTGEVPALGLIIALEGSEEEVTAPADKENYIDVASVIALVEKTVTEVKEIIAAEDIAFTVNGNAVIDGTAVAVSGEGEVIWTEGKVQVAVALEITVDGQKIALNFVYDMTAVENDDVRQPLVTLTLGEVGLKLYNSEIDNLAQSFEKILGAFTKGNSEKIENPAAVHSLDGQTVDGILENANVKKAIGAVLDILCKLTVALESDNLNAERLVIGFAKDGKLTLSSDGCIALSLTKDGKYDIGASVEAGAGHTVQAVSEKFKQEGYVFYDIEGFARWLYGKVFDVIDGLTLTEVLGTDAYEVKIGFNGANSGIEAIENVNIQLNGYYAEGLTGGKIGNKLIKTNLKLDIGGTLAEATLAYSGRVIYAELLRVGATTFGDLRFKAQAEDLFDIVNLLVRLVVDTNILSVITNGAVAVDADNIAPLAEGENGSRLTAVLYSLLNLDPEKSFVFDKNNGTAQINIDPVLQSAFGITIGTVYAEYDGIKKTVSASVKNDAEAPWLTLNANPASESVKNENNSLDPDRYMDIKFLSTLINDLTNTAFDESKQMYTLYTFTGNINVNIIKLSDINFENARLTAGLGADGNFYLSLKAHVGSGLAVGEACDISITYSNGYITLGRKVDTAEEEFKVMTLEYMLDHLLTSDSVLKWLLKTSDFTWSLASLAFGSINLNSGLTKPGEYALYEMQQLQTEGRFNLSNYINGFSAYADGENTTSFGNGAAGAISRFNLTDNYYAVDIDARAVTGNILTSLQAAILRDGSGISGIKAYGAIDSYVTFNLTFDNYLKGEKQDVTPDYFERVRDNYGFDANHVFTPEEGSNVTPIFGCYSTNGNSYASSDVLEEIYIDVYDGESLEKTVGVRYGSKVHLTGDFPEFASDGRKLIYLNANGEKLPSAVTVADGEAGLMLERVDGVRRIRLFKSSESAVAVRFRMGGLINDVTAAFGEDGSLPAYNLNNYTLLGWYNDPEFTVKAENVAEITNFEDGVRTVYGWFVQSEYVINGVIYTFSADNGGSYTVTGYDSALIEKFTSADATLVLENVIMSGGNAYPVTAIGAKAFEKANLKNVVVPENIVAVNDQAFLDNYGILTVVFLADNVTLKGGSDKEGVFYGCSASDGGTSTNLNVYYNNITCNEGADAWRHFRTSGVIKKKYYIGDNGGSYNNGGWAYVNYTVEAEGGFNAENLSLASGLITSSAICDNDALIAHLRNTVDFASERTYGAINVYSVDTEGVLALDGKLHDVKVTVGLNPENEWLYGLTVSVDGDGVDVVTRLDGHSAVFNGKTYVNKDAKIVLSPSATSHVFDKITVNGKEITFAEEVSEYVINGVNSETVVSVTFKAAVIDEITLISQVEAAGYEYADGLYTSCVNADEFTVDLTPTADGYTFAGWAYTDNGKLAVIDESSVSHTQYYALWAENRDGVTLGGRLKAGTDFYSADNGLTAEASEGALYGWYTDGDFTSQSVSGTSTVLYPRFSYTAYVTLEGANTDFYYTCNAAGGYTDMTISWGSVKGHDGTVKSGGTFEISSVPEGYGLQVYRYWTNALAVRVYDGENLIKTYLFKALKTNGASRSWRDMCNDADHYIQFNSGNWTVPDNVISGANGYYLSGGEQLFGTCRVTGNSAMTLKV